MRRWGSKGTAKEGAYCTVRNSLCRGCQLAAPPLTQPGCIHGTCPTRLTQARPVALFKGAVVRRVGSASGSWVGRGHPSVAGRTSWLRPVPEKLSFMQMRAVQHVTSGEWHRGGCGVLPHTQAGGASPAEACAGSPAEAGPTPLERVPLEAVPAAGQGTGATAG